MYKSNHKISSKNIAQRIAGSVFRRFTLLIILLILTMANSCSEDSIVAPGDSPELKIDSIVFPDTVWVNSDYDFTVKAAVSGNTEGNVILVVGSLNVGDVPDFAAEFILYDDGTHFDNIPGDNEFTSRISSSIFENNTGSIAIEVTGSSSANKPYTTVGTALTISVIAVDGFLNTSPILSNLSAPDSVRFDLSETTMISVNIIDEQGFADITNVTRWSLSLTSA